MLKQDFQANKRSFQGVIDDPFFIERLGALVAVELSKKALKY